MYILDTDHLSFLERKGDNAQPLLQRMREIDPAQISTTIISYEEQMRGWLSYIAKAQTEDKQVEAYKQLKNQLMNYCAIPVIEFNLGAVREFNSLRKIYPRLGTMDLKIAAITIVNRSILLTKNSSDFGQILGLPIEDWTTPVENLY
jgi:tRNA(fMet)-specific endonuclease VapC